MNLVVPPYVDQGRPYVIAESDVDSGQTIDPTGCNSSTALLITLSRMTLKSRNLLSYTIVFAASAATAL
jgi:hypothetical protein